MDSETLAEFELLAEKVKGRNKYMDRLMAGIRDLNALYEAFKLTPFPPID